METHEDPDNAPSDGPNMIKLEDMDEVIRKIARYQLA
jgi:2-dehydro-3-deoxyphosphooctonate aldolase (KDO 8-P synthase)